MKRGVCQISVLLYMSSFTWYFELNKNLFLLDFILEGPNPTRTDDRHACRFCTAPLRPDQVFSFILIMLIFS